MDKVLKKNYGFYEAEYSDIKPFFEFIVFGKNEIDLWWNFEDLENIKKILKKENWKKDSKKTYDKEVEMVYTKENKKIFLYHDKWQQ